MVINNSTQNIWRGRIIRYAPLILWISVIFFASSTAGTSKNTSLFVRPFLVWLFPEAPAATLDVYHGYVRKLAHFAEYAALAFFASRAFWDSSFQILRRFWFIYAFLIVALVAATDEYSQSFNILRTGSIYDTLIDASGGLTMILFLFSVIHWRGNK